MQREASDDRVERIGVGELLKCGGPEEIAVGRVGIDRHDPVACACHRSREIAPPAPHVEHARRRRRKVLMDERVKTHPSARTQSAQL